MEQPGPPGDPQPPAQPPATQPPAQPPAAQPPAAGQALDSFSLLDRESRRRRDTDVQLSFAMYLVVGFITFGIYVIYVNFKLIQRQQEHFKRMGRFNEDLFQVIQERAEATGQTASIERDTDELRQLNEDYQRLQRGKERNPALWIILSIITLGLAFLFVLWFLNDDLTKHQAAESEYIEKASAVLNKLGIGRHPVKVEHVVPDRSYPLYLFLTIITIGFFEIYWAYVRIRDPNEHFLEHDRFEDQLVGMIRSAA
jgi:ABC-type multidrug transport system fused ATPase/permease subunit